MGPKPTVTKLTNRPTCMSSRSNSKSRIFFSWGGRFHLPWRFVWKKQAPENQWWLGRWWHVLFGANLYIHIYIYSLFFKGFYRSIYMVFTYPNYNPNYKHRLEFGTFFLGYVPHCSTPKTLKTRTKLSGFTGRFTNLKTALKIFKTWSSWQEITMEFHQMRSVVSLK